MIKVPSVKINPTFTITQRIVFRNSKEDAATHPITYHGRSMQRSTMAAIRSFATSFGSNLTEKKQSDCQKISTSGLHSPSQVYYAIKWRGRNPWFNSCHINSIHVAERLQKTASWNTNNNKLISDASPNTPIVLENTSSFNHSWGPPSVGH